jgi:hypothetical protein
MGLPTQLALGTEPHGVAMALIAARYPWPRAGQHAAMDTHMCPMAPMIAYPIGSCMRRISYAQMS